jgi:alkanesulfonate monooxygenase SsuD/methylene tetrahydromethanopterin reductase-like flavin-dependent oxidoreductase (luciferase family)
LANKETTFSGSYFNLTDAWCEPKPVQAKIPLAIGGKGRTRTLKTVAKFADHWDITFPAVPADWVELDEVLRGHCATVGRDPSEITRSIHLGFTPDSDPAELADQAASFFDVGVELVIWSMQGPMRPDRLGPFAAALY